MALADKQTWATIKACVDQCLVDGYSPPGFRGGKGSALSEAQRRLKEAGVHCSNTHIWSSGQAARKMRGKEHFSPDWSKFDGAPAEYEAPVTKRFRQTLTAGPRAASAAINHVNDNQAKRPRLTWLLTSAQDDTAVHGPFLANLEAYAEHIGATLHIAPFTYNKSVFTDHETRNGCFAEAVQQYLQFDSLPLGSTAVFCAEMNTLPTATRPLSGLHSYTRGRTGIFPHAKLALESVPSMPGFPATILMTTGACTVENYIAKKAGLKAAFHHVIGATIVEQDEHGLIFCRQINASRDGSFQDLDTYVSDGAVTTGHRVEAVTWGDIHHAKLDEAVAFGAFGLDIEPAGRRQNPDNMLDVLRPRYQFFHDVLDFESRNHHEENNPHTRFELYVRGRDSLETEIANAARFLRSTERDWCKSVVVESNHDLWIEGWLQKSDYRRDPTNAVFFLKAQLAAYEAREREEEGFSIFRHVMRLADPSRLANIEFSPENGSYRICPEFGGIECGSHGHLGPNGARGSSASLIKISVKMNKGHDHTASIFDAVYSAGVSARLQHGYNKGPSSWSHSHIVVYPSGKRTIVTMQGSKWRA